MIVLGVDLSGPSNVASTAVVSLNERSDHLEVAKAVTGVGDLELIDLCQDAAEHGDVVIGVDAPLSYNPGGGDRVADTELRSLVIARGLRPGSVMAPTAMRMVYLTLRGLAVSRALSAGANVRIVEVHPTATLVLRGANATDVRELKRSREARKRLLSWLELQGLRGASRLDASNDHLVAACACALATWGWFKETTAWVWRSTPPVHPYDFAC